MKSEVTIRVYDTGMRANAKASLSFASNGRVTYMGYSKKLADLVKPYLEAEETFDVETTINMEDGTCLKHTLTSFKKSGGVVVKDDTPLDMTKGAFSLRGKIPYVWLELMDPNVGTHGSNKWYSLKGCPTDNTLIDANYARHGATDGSQFGAHATKPFQYPVYMYYLKLYEKMAKGYEDHTKERVLNDGSDQPANAAILPDGTNATDGITDTQVASLVKNLMDFADATIKKNYSVKVGQVNAKAIESARKMITRMSKSRNVDTFNKRRLELMHIIPRKMDCVSSYMVNSKSEFAQVIQDESDLLDVLETQVEVAIQQGTASDGDGTKKQTILDKLGLEIYSARQDQIDKIKGRLPKDLQDKVLHVYRVINKKTKARFDNYLKSQGHRVKVKEFWHGSRNANWWNIICKGLLLRNDAQKTGSMFGHGLYFAPSPTKSWGYTSAYGSYWANGNSKTAFMGVYAISHDNPVNVNSYSSVYGNLDASSFEAKYPGHDCLYCHGGTGMLRNDEVIVYREEQATINFIVEFAA